MKEPTEKKGSLRTQVHHVAQVEVSSTPSSSTTTRKLQVGNFMVETIDEAMPEQDQGPLYTKESRDTMTPEKLNDLYKEAVKPSQAKYDFTSMTLTDEKRLDDLYNMNIMIAKKKQQHRLYDMADVFTIVFPMVAGGKTLETTEITNNMGDAVRVPNMVDLYAQYDELTEEDVARSCEWYNKWTARNYYRDDLTLTYRHLENNMTYKLFNKTFKRYKAYPILQQGGPLLFIIMMKTLISSSDEATDYLKSMVKQLKITDFKGEYVPRVVSLLRAVYKRLRWIKKVPTDFPKTILKVFQTSSVPEFNDYFAHYASQYTMMRDIAEIERATFRPMEVDPILRIAEKTYHSLLASGDWTGAKTKGKASIFFSDESNSTNSTNKSKDTSHAGLNASKIETVCWNCGQLGHAFTTCPKPRNEQRIARAKSQYMENKRAKKATKQANVGVAPTTQTNKWRPPTANEDNKCIIDGKHMFYFHKTKRWMLDKHHPSNQLQGDTTNITTTASSGQLSDNSNPRSPDLEAALANTTRAIESSLHGLVNQFTNT